MFWDGTRWIVETPPPSANPSTQGRLKDLIATLVMVIALVGLVFPTVDTAASPSPASHTLIAKWTQSFNTATYQETSRKVSYKGHWLINRHGGYLGGAVRSSDMAGARVSIVFTGSGISWIGAVGPTRGKAAVYIDGKRVDTVDTYDRRFRPSRELFTRTFAESGKHRLTIRVLGTEGHPTVAVDSFVVRGEAKVSRGVAKVVHGEAKAGGRLPKVPGATPAATQLTEPTNAPTSTQAATAAPVTDAPVPSATPVPTPVPPTASPVPTPRPTAAPTPVPTAAPTPASGVAMPVGNLPGWRQVFSDDFTTAVAMGQFPAAVSTKWSAYPEPWRDTSLQGAYSPKIVSFHDGMMDIYLHTEAGIPRVAAPLPLIPGATNWSDQLYGRYAVRFRADPVPGYTTAWLLWPKSNVWPRDGEIDFPEGNLNGTINAFMHRQGATSGGDQDAYPTTARYPDWHTAVIEWAPGRVQFFLDGVSIGTSTDRVPNTPMHWVLQTETALGTMPTASAAGHVLIDWVAIWAYSP